MTWELLWKVVFIAGVSAFSAMAILVTIGGYRDIRKLIASLRHSANDPDEE